MAVTASSPFPQRGQNRGGECHGRQSWSGASSSHGAPIMTWFLPMWSRRREESNLPTYRGGNNREKAGNEKVPRAAFNGGGDSIWRCSSSKNSSGSGGVGGGSSSNRQIETGGFSVAPWRWWRGSAMAARVCAKFVGDRVLFKGVLDPTRRGDGVLQFLSLNRTQIRLRSKDIAKGMILSFGYDIGRNSRLGWGNPIGLTGLAQTPGRLLLGVRMTILAGLATLSG
jgi:hypothetical protein